MRIYLDWETRKRQTLGSLGPWRMFNFMGFWVLLDMHGDALLLFFPKFKNMALQHD